MTLDELVFIREKLKRDLVALDEKIDLIANNYDPEVLPVQDILVLLASEQVFLTLAQYRKEILRRLGIYRQAANEKGT